MSELPSSKSDQSSVEQLDVARQSLASGEFQFCLKLCSNLLINQSLNSEIYDCASDAYLNLRRFRESEICLLNALSIGGGTPKRYLNLVSFACMRSDFKLAKYYLEKAAALDPSHPQLMQITSLVNKQEQKSSSDYEFFPKWDEPHIN